MTSSLGKIIQLPAPILTELHHRLAAHEPGRTLLPWLNSLPEVQTLLRTSFHSAPINHQNLSNYRRGPFAEWQAREDLLNGFKEMAADATDFATIFGNDTLPDHVARLIAIQFAHILCPNKAVRGLPHSSSTSSPLAAPTIKLLCQMARAIATLRKNAPARPSASASTQKSSHPTPSNTIAQTAPPSPCRSHSSYPSHPSAPPPKSSPPTPPFNSIQPNSTLQPRLHLRLPTHPSSIAHYLSSIPASLPTPPPTFLPSPRPTKSSPIGA